MAVQAQNPSNPFGDLRNCASQLANMESRNFLSPIPFDPSLLDDRNQTIPQTAAIQSHQRLFHPIATPAVGSPIPNFTLFHQPVVDVTARTMTARKRRKESNDRRSSQHHRQQQPVVLPLVDLNQVQGSCPVAPQSVVVSTGLRLAFDDERSTVTSSKPDAGSAVLSRLRDELSAGVSRQREELDQFLASQAEQLRQALEERTQRQLRTLLSSVEDGVSQRIREREMELERLNRRNLELEDRVKHLSMESHMWQSKAKSNEAMVAVLRANLQQAVVQSREQSKEGCGDSEADDAASAHVDSSAGAGGAQGQGIMGKDNGDTVRTCRICKIKEVSILLLPCLHLCLCNDCNGDVERCPLCHFLKSASVEVFMS